MKSKASTILQSVALWTVDWDVWNKEPRYMNDISAISSQNHSSRKSYNKSWIRIWKSETILLFVQNQKTGELVRCQNICET